MYLSTSLLKANRAEKCAQSQGSSSALRGDSQCSGTTFFIFNKANSGGSDCTSLRTLAVWSVLAFHVNSCLGQAGSLERDKPPVSLSGIQHFGRGRCRGAGAWTHWRCPGRLGLDRIIPTEAVSRGTK
jgi:hypothetical protein